MFLLWPPVISNTILGRRVPPGAFPKTDKSVNFFMALHLCGPTQTTTSTHNSVVLLKSRRVNREWYTRCIQMSQFVPWGWYYHVISYIYIFINAARKNRIILTRKIFVRENKYILRGKSNLISVLRLRKIPKDIVFFISFYYIFIGLIIFDFLK